MTEHEKRVEWLLQEIANELADLVFYTEKRDGSWDSARATMELYKRNVSDLKDGLNQEIMTNEILRRQKKRFRWFKWK